MESLIWIAWAVLGVVFVIAEIFTTGFVLLWFGLGALLAAFVGAAGGGYGLQFMTFFASSVLLTILSRTIFDSYFAAKTKPALKTGADALPGKIGIVTTESSGALDEAAVKVFGSTWTAYPTHGEAPLQIGEQVVVESISGSSIRVRRAGNIPSYRDHELLAPPTE